MLAWNVLTTWWIWNASAPGAVGAFLANSLLMCFPWVLFRITKKKLGKPIGYTSLIAFWLCFEYIHLHDWGLSWPWLTLGNVFATHPSWIQWYEYTGTSGGSLWIMIVNIFLFLHVRRNFISGGTRSYKNLVIAFILLILPIGLSSITAVHKTTIAPQHNIVIVQPNIDPYEKIAEGTFDAQLKKIIMTSESAIDENTALVVWPETALYTANGIEENKMKENPQLKSLWDFLGRHPGISLFTGVESFRSFASATKYSQNYNGQFYEAYNGSVLLDSSGPLNYYHKSMLVPGVETLPWFLKFIDKWFEKFGGTTAGYAKQDKRIPLTDAKHGYAIAPAICYESIYGEFMSKYIRNGANIICIITNDGWWGNTPGYKQHMNYARLRAIETRKWVVRSANTGISCFIDPYGNAFDAQPWNKASAIKLNVPTNDQKTFFVRYGDILSKIFSVISILILILNISYWVKKKFF